MSLIGIFDLDYAAEEYLEQLRKEMFPEEAVPYWGKPGKKRSRRTGRR